VSTTTELLVGAPDHPDEQAQQFFDRILAAARPGAVFSPPVVSGSYTVITASQVFSAGGFGSGSGVGPARPPSGENAAPASGSMPVAALAGGKGMGGGGGASGRPVAAIIIGPEGVTIKPILDFTSLTLTGLTVAATILGVMARRRRLARG
jgi:uncharacterized spore protein YtfJ